MKRSKKRRPIKLTVAGQALVDLLIGLVLILLEKLINKLF